MVKYFKCLEHKAVKYFDFMLYLVLYSKHLEVMNMLVFQALKLSEMLPLQKNNFSLSVLRGVTTYLYMFPQNEISARFNSTWHKIQWFHVEPGGKQKFR